jgi:hypothetical protein
MATIECGINHEDTKYTYKYSYNTNNMTKPQTDTFSKYCKGKS